VKKKGGRGRLYLGRRGKWPPNPEDLKALKKEANAKEEKERIYAPSQEGNHDGELL